MPLAIKSSIFLILILTASIVPFLPYVVQTSSIDNIRGVQNETAGSTADRSLIVKLLADNLENRLNKSAAILEITSRLRDVKNVPYANSIDSTLHGIPKDLDIPKRNIAQHILAADKDFQLIFFLMPNGDMYIQEPYSRQENLTRNNFAFRDYHKGAVSSGDTYLGNIVISASSGLPQVNIAVPIYSDGNNSNISNETSSSLSGIWAAGLNLTRFSESLQSLNLANSGQRVVYVDQQGQKIADSDKQSLFNGNQNELFANLQSFKNVVKGQSGSIIEAINGTKTLVFYEPVKFHSTTWAALLLQPYYSSSNNNTMTLGSSANATIVPAEAAVVFEANSKPHGLTYGEWTARWWQWAYSIPKHVHPAYDDTGKYCALANFF
jgi:Cache domain